MASVACRFQRQCRFPASKISSGCSAVLNAYLRPCYAIPRSCRYGPTWLSTGGNRSSTTPSPSLLRTSEPRAARLSRSAGSSMKTWVVNILWAWNFRFQAIGKRLSGDHLRARSRHWLAPMANLNPGSLKDAMQPNAAPVLPRQLPSGHSARMCDRHAASMRLNLRNILVDTVGFEPTTR